MQGAPYLTLKFQSVIRVSGASSAGEFHDLQVLEVRTMPVSTANSPVQWCDDVGLPQMRWSAFWPSRRIIMQSLRCYSSHTALLRPKPPFLHLGIPPAHCSRRTLHLTSLLRHCASPIVASGHHQTWLVDLVCYLTKCRLTGASAMQVKKDTPAPEVRQNYFRLSRSALCIQPCHMKLSPCRLCQALIAKRTANVQGPCTHRA